MMEFILSLGFLILFPGIGYFKDDPKLLIAAAEYLREGTTV